VSQILGKKFPELSVAGNYIPPHFMPIKGSDNKYFNTRNNKYVVFPDIGSFEVRFRGKLLFSKKKTNSWPDFN
jgi:selT/selW/selH-like putative selenoprotein